MAKKPDKVDDFKSNYFIISGENLKKLAAGDMKLEEVAKPENIALFTWSGADIIKMLKEGSDFMFARNVPLPEEVDVESLIDNVADALGYVDETGVVLRAIVNEELDALEKQQHSEKEED